MSDALLGLFAGSVALGAYAYAGYPTLLWLLGRLRPRHATAPPVAPARWPLISIVIPAYNEEVSIRGTLERVLEIDYPEDRRQILVLSDASTDGTDAIVRELAGRGVELFRLPKRGGKTAAENASLPLLRGEIVVNTDASVGIDPGAVKRLVLSLADPTVGAASGRDVSIAVEGASGEGGESAYVGYEMWVRALETAVSGIVGTSGCLYAIRAGLHRRFVPDGLSRDFAAALTAREAGLQTVSVPDALCFVPRTSSLREEYRRKVRTIARGLATLFDRRTLLNPLRYGRFAWMLASHKLCRWLVPWAMLVALGAITGLAVTEPWARWAVLVVVSGGAVAAAGWWWPEGKQVPPLARLAAYAVAGNVAVLHAWLRAMGRRTPMWEPTRRQSPAVSRPQHHRQRPEHDLEILQR
ncbi:MAG: glycosyltransferase [Gemmatimonadetes bacterium]|nr:glycosyltransferase [Gemmatimonadota bacterium]